MTATAAIKKPIMLWVDPLILAIIKPATKTVTITAVFLIFILLLQVFII